MIKLGKYSFGDQYRVAVTQNKSVVYGRIEKGIIIKSVTGDKING